MTDSNADSGKAGVPPDAPAERPLTGGMKRQFAWSLAPLLVVTVLNLFSVRLFMRYLGDEMYALWGFVATFTGLFGFADLGLGSAVGRYVGLALAKGDREAVREYWGTGNLIVLPLLALMGLAFLGLGVVFGPHWFNVSPANENLLRACFAIGGFALFFNYYSQYWLILSQAHLDFKFIGLLRSVSSVLQIVPSVVLAWYTRNPLLITLWGSAIGLLQLIAYVWHVRRRFHLGLELRHARRARLREMAVYTGKMFSSLIAGSVFGSIDRILLGRFAPKDGTDFVNYTNAAANVGGRLQGLGVGVMGPVIYNTTRAVGSGRHAAPAAIYDETFHFVFGWYLLAAVGAAIWHPVLLRLWLGLERGMQVAPIFTPVIIAYCLTAISSISGAQLAALNRVGASIGFTVAGGVLAGVGVWVGWKTAGIVGVAYGFLGSRIAFLAQDVFTITLIRAKGWFSAQTWKSVGAQCAVGGLFACARIFVPRESLWLLLPAAVHGGLVAAWLSRHYVRKLMAGVFIPQTANV